MNLYRYRILAVGKVKKAWIQEGINLYLKRLPGLIISEIRNSNPKKEAQIILSSLKKNEHVVLLGEESSAFSSIEFSQKLDEFGKKRLVFIIGGTDGVSSELEKVAHMRLSLSPLTFPHEIARLLLIEQIYRAQSILTKSPYHRS